jgi:hypothetical protein
MNFTSERLTSFDLFETKQWLNVCSIGLRYLTSISPTSSTSTPGSARRAQSNIVQSFSNIVFPSVLSRENRDAPPRYH